MLLRAPSVSVRFLWRRCKWACLHALARHVPPPVVPLCDYHLMHTDGAASLLSPAQEEDGISIITAVMDRTPFLLQALPTWLRQPNVREILIVDWSSRIPVAPSVATLHDDRIRVVRVTGQRRWVLSWAFNLAAHLARHSVLLKLDSDVQLEADFSGRHALAEQDFFRGNFRRLGKGLTGMLLVRRRDLLAVNGYNEHMVTYGREDIDLYERLEHAGLRPRDILPGTCAHLPHSDALRLRRQRLRIPLKAVSTLQNRHLSTQYPIWSMVHNRLTLTEDGSVRRIRELDPETFIRQTALTALAHHRWGPDGASLLLLPPHIRPIDWRHLRRLPPTAALFCRDEQCYAIAQERWPHANRRLFLWPSSAGAAVH